MDAIVTARVPVAVKEQVTSLLREMGSTPSQLVNAAYEYVLVERKLPRAGTRLGEGVAAPRQLTQEQLHRITSALEAMHVGPAEDDRTLDEQLREARDERYAAFA